MKNGGYITLSKETGTSDSGEQLWRIGHGLDHLSDKPFFLISKDLFYNVYATRTTYKTVSDPPTEENPEGGSHTETTTAVTENTTYSAAQGQGITEWWVNVH